MWEDLLIFLILIFLIAPISLLIHEIGHAIGAKLMHASSIQLTIGIGKEIWEGTILNINVSIRKFFIVNSFTSTVREKPFGRYEKIIISLLGPGFSGGTAFSLYVIYSVFFPDSILYVFFLFNVWLFVINLLPIKIGKKQSDGYTICKLLLTKP